MKTEKLVNIRVYDRDGTLLKTDVTLNKWAVVAALAASHVLAFGAGALALFVYVLKTFTFP